MCELPERVDNAELCGILAPAGDREKEKKGEKKRKKSCKCHGVVML